MAANELYRQSIGHRKKLYSSSLHLQTTLLAQSLAPLSCNPVDPEEDLRDPSGHKEEQKHLHS